MDGSRSNVTLYLSPRLEQVLGGPKGLNIPDFKRDISLSQYVTSVSIAIKNKFDFIVEHYRMKKIFISTLVAICNNSIVEYDTESFTKAVFLHTVGDYNCLVSLIIGKFIIKFLAFLLFIFFQDKSSPKRNLQLLYHLFTAKKVGIVLKILTDILTVLMTLQKRILQYY